MGTSPPEKANVTGKEPVTSRTWFTTKQRWCTCQSRQNQDRVSAGKPPLRSALWQDDRTKATNRKHPQISFAQWSQAVTALREQAEQSLAHTSARELAQHVRRDEALLSHLIEVAMRDQDARAALLSLVERVEPVVTGLHMQATEHVDQLVITLQDVALRDSSHAILSCLVEETRHLVNWQAIFFRLAYEQAHAQSQSMASKTRRKPGGDLWARDGLGQSRARTRLVVVEDGPIHWQKRDPSAVREENAVRDLSGTITAGYQGRKLVSIHSQSSERITDSEDAATGKEVMAKACYDLRTPPADSFSPYDYLYRFFKGCVALAVVDESHNGRGRDTDIARSHHVAMLAAQTRQLTSGTHYGGEVLSFYHYWFRYNPTFWQRRGFGWKDAEKALHHYGVIQHWTKEYESDARRGSGQTDVRVSTIPAPGLSAKLIPGLLEDLTYLTVLDVGAHMPPKKEMPRGISMSDPTLEQAVREAETRCREAMKEMAATQKAYQEATSTTEAIEFVKPCGKIRGKSCDGNTNLLSHMQHKHEGNTLESE